MNKDKLKGEVLYNYKSVEVDELTLFVGEEVNVMEMYDDGWWLVSKNNVDSRNPQAVGLAPSNYIKLIESQLPEGWKFSVDTDSNEKYYYNEVTGVVQWEKPIQILSSNEKKNSIASPLLKNKNIKQLSSKSLSFRENENQVTLQTADLKRLQELRVQAEEKISALR